MAETYRVAVKNPGEPCCHLEDYEAPGPTMAADKYLAERGVANTAIVAGSLVVVLHEDTCWIFQTETKITLVDEEHVNHGVPLPGEVTA